MALFKSAPCSEASCIIQYVEDRLNGKSVQQPTADYPIHQRMLNHFLPPALPSGTKSKSSRRLLKTSLERFSRCHPVHLSFA